MSGSIVAREPHALQDYQTRLNEALADPTINTEAVIAMEMGGQGWIVALQDLAETSLCPDLARTGKMPPGVMGVGNFRGRVNTVVSMPGLFGVEEEDHRGGWATVLHPRFEAAVALWWPRMLGLFSRSDFTRHPMQPPQMARMAWVNGDARVWLELDTEHLLRTKLGLADVEVPSGQ